MSKKEVMANMINYLNVSLYEGQFTYNHEQARERLNTISESESDSQDDCLEFYKNVLYLKNVTDTDDPVYHTYMRQLSKQ